MALLALVTLRRRIRYDFYVRRLSALGCARKYGKTVRQIEEVLRW